MKIALGIRGQLALGLSSLLLVAGTIAGLLVVRLVAAEAEARVLEAQRRQVGTLSALLVATCAASEDCHAGMDRALRTRRHEALVAAAVYTHDQQVLAGRHEARVASPLVGDVLQGSASVSATVERPASHPRGAGLDHRVARRVRLRDGRTVAVLATFSLDSLHATIAGDQRLVLLYLLFDFVAVLAFGMYLGGRYLVQPIRRLTTAATTEGADVPLLDGPVELAGLSRAFADLVHRLRERNDELAQSIAALESARDELVRSERLATVGRLAAGVAHEVGNPLASVVGYLEFLRDDRGVKPEIRADLHARMDRELERIRLTIRSLLDFSRTSPVEPTRCELDEIVDSAVELVRVQRRTRGIAIEVEGDAPAVRVVADHLRQVLVNLLLNAADALQGEGTVQLRISTRESDACVEVADDGPGVPADSVAQIFDPFFTTKPSGEGTGLGLAICQRIIEESGGRLWLADTEDTGACFAFTVPLA